MIKITDNTNDIVLCWNEAFGDCKEDIVYFLENAKNYKCISLYSNDSICAMLILIDAYIDSTPTKYIYAACTLKKFRNNGYMTEILEFLKSSNSNLVLIPANENLISYYNRRGFNLTHTVDKIKFEQSDEIIDYLFDGCELEKPILLQYIGG